MNRILKAIGMGTVLILLAYFISSSYIASASENFQNVINPANLNLTNDARQMVIVTTSDESSFKARIYTFEKDNGAWKQVFSPMAGVIGMNGFTSQKKEGDNKSPSGMFSFGTFFGKNSNPNVKFPYRQATAKDYWIDDVSSKDYNTWQTFSGNPKLKWKSFEKLRRKDNLYDYAAVINYNLKRVPGKGSAIFFHIWRDANHGTEGCTATSEANLLKILKWLNPSMKPVILEGTASDIQNMQVSN